MTNQTNGKNASIPRGYKSEDSTARVDWVKKFAGIDIDDTLEDSPEELRGIIENHVGFMKVPMAVVGPLLLDGVMQRASILFLFAHLKEHWQCQ